MSSSLTALPPPLITPDVQDFASEKGVSPYLQAAIDVARQAFPASALFVSVGQDAEDETHRYIALDVETGGLSAEELIAGLRTWSSKLGGVCPSRHAVYFVLGWR